MGRYSYFSKLLDKVEGHSTVIGRVWMNSLFIFRLLTLVDGASLVWWDEHNLFVCKTNEPGCENTCYSAAFPISFLHFWTMQILFVSAPTLVHVLYGIYSIHQDEKPNSEERQVPKEMLEVSSNAESVVKTETTKKPQLHHYVIRMCFKIVLEVVFIVCQYTFIGFVIKSEIKCMSSPCPHPVDCFVPRFTEKNIFSIFMVALACVSLLLNVAEVTFSLLTRKRRQHSSGNPSSANRSIDKL